MRILKERALLPTDLLCYDESSYIQEFISSYNNREIVLFDTETTGLNVFDDDIVQIAAIKIRNGKKIPGSDLVIYMEMREGKALPKEIAGEENPMIKAMYDARKQGLIVSRQQGLKEFMDYCQNTVLIAHNINYDYNILDNNLKRDLPNVNLYESNPIYFDTLKLIRLLEPKLKVYKLVSLLQALNLKGENSHNAIDDVNATFELLNYCQEKAEAIRPSQEEFLQNNSIKAIAQKLSNKYKDLYFDAIARKTKKQDENDSFPLLVQEMTRAYEFFIQIKAIEEISKWEHIQTYFAKDLIDTEQYPYMVQQLDAYITDITTSKEADMCGGESMKEKVFVSTVYKAKGLEFDNVIVVNCNEGVYPFYLSVEEENIKEDARKLYVAMSRAQKRLCLVWCMEKGSITRFIVPIAHFFAGSTS